MIGYATLGTNNMERALAFYDALLAQLGASRMMNGGRIVIYGKEMGVGMVAICIPYDEQEATPGNGNMLALNVGTKDAVNEMYAKALELGATDEGAPGPRGDGPFYGGYFRDLDGNKLCAFCFGG
jgi:predicted lactoylglutathione lyase